MVSNCRKHLKKKLKDRLINQGSFKKDYITGLKYLLFFTVSLLSHGARLL